MSCYIFGEKEIDEILIRFILINANESIYIDSITNIRWLLSNYWSEMLEVELKILVKLPLCTIEYYIKNLSLDKTVPELIVIALLISDRNFDNLKSNRLLLIEKLESLMSEANDSTSMEKIKNIIYETSLYDPTNKDTIINKHFSQINSDAQFYRNISIRAQNILNTNSIK